MRLTSIICAGLLAFSMVAPAAEPALNVELGGETVLDGAADERLAAIGKQAADEGLALQVNAPDLWERRIVQPIRSGGGDTRLKIKFVNTLSDKVVIRGVPEGEAEDPLDTLKRITSSAKAHSAGIETKPQSQSAGQASASSGRTEAPPEIERPHMSVPDVRVERPKAQLPGADAARSARAASRSEIAAAARADSAGNGGPREANASKPAPPAAPDRPDSDAAEDAAREERDRFERLYNDGRPIRETLPAAQLEKGDLVFTGEAVNVVVRRGISTEAFWLDGPVPEARVNHEQRNRYEVVAKAERAAAESAPAPSVSVKPGAERDRFERLYNRGSSIDEQIGVAELEPGDAIFMGSDVAVVVRPSRVRSEAYWIDSSINLDQAGIEHDTKNKYLVVGEVR